MTKTGLSALLLCHGAAAARPVVYSEATFGVRNETDVVYGQGLSCADQKRTTNCQPMDLLLDVASPVVDGEIAGSAAARPAYIMMHGGSWSTGSKGGGWTLGSSVYFASRGFVTFDIDYRLDKDNGPYPSGWQFPSRKEYPATRDLKAAIRFVRANAVRFGIDPDRVALAGGSAGAISSIAAGNVDEDDYKMELIDSDPTLQSTNLDTSSKVQCVTSHWGAGYGVEIPQLADPSNRTRYGAGAAPIIEFHGDQDTSVPYTDALAVQAAYQSLGNDYELHTLTGCGHGAWCAGCPDLAVGDQCVCGGDNAQFCHALDITALPFIAQHLDLDLVSGPTPSPSPSPSPGPDPKDTCKAQLQAEGCLSAAATVAGPENPCEKCALKHESELESACAGLTRWQIKQLCQAARQDEFVA